MIKLATEILKVKPSLPSPKRTTCCTWRVLVSPAPSRSSLLTTEGLIKKSSSKAIPSESAQANLSKDTFGPASNQILKNQSKTERKPKAKISTKNRGDGLRAIISETGGDWLHFFLPLIRVGELDRGWLANNGSSLAVVSRTQRLVDTFKQVALGYGRRRVGSSTSNAPRQMLTTSIVGALIVPSASAMVIAGNLPAIVRRNAERQRPQLVSLALRKAEINASAQQRPPLSKRSSTEVANVVGTQSDRGTDRNYSSSSFGTIMVRRVLRTQYA